MDFKRACWTLINKRALVRHKRVAQMKGVLMHPPHPPTHSGFCSISSRPEGPGYHRRMHSVKTAGVDEFLSSVSKLIIKQQVLQRGRSHVCARTRQAKIRAEK